MKVGGLLLPLGLDLPSILYSASRKRDNISLAKVKKKKKKVYSAESPLIQGKGQRGPRNKVQGQPAYRIDTPIDSTSLNFKYGKK